MDVDLEKIQEELKTENIEITGQVIDAITEGQVKVRPKWQLLAKSGLLILVCVLLAIVLFYLESFIFFSLRHTGIILLPTFGPRGWLAFLLYLPWLLILLSLILILILEMLLRRYSLAYHRPLLYSLLVILVGAGFVGYLLAPCHQPIYRVAKENRLPLAGRFYRELDHRNFSGIRHGMMVSVSGTNFVIQSWDGATSSVIVGDSDDFHNNVHFQQGDELFFFGDEEPDNFRAQGMRIMMRQMASQ